MQNSAEHHCIIAEKMQNNAELQDLDNLDMDFLQGYMMVLHCSAFFCIGSAFSLQ